jgi:hypothetical protein
MITRTQPLTRWAHGEMAEAIAAARKLSGSLPVAPSAPRSKADRRNADHSAAWRARRKALGMCLGCTAQRAPGRPRCLACLETARVISEHRRRAEGVWPSDLSNTREAVAIRKRKDERIAQGICTQCGKNQPRPKRKTCAKCADTARTKEQEKKPTH